MSAIVRKTHDFILVNPDTIAADIDPTTIDTTNGAKANYWIYVLQLEHGKYYVGYTAYQNPYDRILDHGTKKGAHWTHRHKPISVTEIRDAGYITRPHVEGLTQNLTWEYIKMFGANNVRGTKLPTAHRIAIIGGRYFETRTLRDKNFIIGILLMAVSVALFLFYFKH